MNRALLLADSLAELARRAEPVVFMPISSFIVRQAMRDVQEQVTDDPLSYSCPGCKASFESHGRRDEDIADVGPVGLFLHMLGCSMYQRAVEPSTADPF